MSAAPDLEVDIFWDEERASRLAAGTSDLTLGPPVKVEMIVKVQESHHS